MSLLGYVGFMLGLIAIFTPLNYWALKSRLGPSIAREQIPEVIISVASLVVISTLNSAAKGDQWSAIKAVIWSSCTILLWGVFAVLALRRPQTGVVLLNLGRLHKGQVWLLPFFGSVGTVIMLIALGSPSNSMTRAEDLAFGVLAWSLGIVLALMGRKETLLTEEGVRTGYTGFNWKQIKNYIWTGMDKGHHYLFFKIKRRTPLANTSLLDVPDELRQAVSNIVIQHTPTDVGSG